MQLWKQLSKLQYGESKMRKLLLTLSLCLVTAITALGGIPENLQYQTVTLDTSIMQASGVIVTRKICENNINFIWTAGHVVKEVRRTVKLTNTQTGEERVIVQY